jgi:UDP:flavonoid glycosyltransferase YjiC (YdhE family)
LVDFLASGPPPVFVGFGSTATTTGPQLSRIVADAAARAGMRLVLQSGWAQLEHAGDDVLTIGSVPHEWLFPRMSALVHHAGAGTTAAGLRAGVPAIPVPGIMDQPYWSSRLVDLGVAPGFRPRRDLDAAWLADAMRAAVHDPRYRIRAQQLSGALTAEAGGAAVVKAVQRLLGSGVASSPQSRAS